MARKKGDRSDSQDPGPQRDPRDVRRIERLKLDKAKLIEERDYWKRRSEQPGAAGGPVRQGPGAGKRRTSGATARCGLREAGGGASSACGGAVAVDDVSSQYQEELPAVQALVQRFESGRAGRSGRPGPPARTRSQDRVTSIGDGSDVTRGQGARRDHTPTHRRPLRSRTWHAACKTHREAQRIPDTLRRTAIGFCSVWEDGRMSIRTPLAIAFVTVTTTLGAAPPTADANWFKSVHKAIEKVATEVRPLGWVVTPTGRVAPVWGTIGVCGCVIDAEAITRCRAMLAQPGYRRVSYRDAFETPSAASGERSTGDAEPAGSGIRADVRQRVAVAR